MVKIDCQNTVESHNSGQVGHPEIVPYCRVFPYFASSLFTNGHFGHSGFSPILRVSPILVAPIASVYCTYVHRRLS